MRQLHWLSFIVLFLPLAGCFSITSEVIGAGDAISVAQLPGNYVNANRDRVEIVPSGSGNDYVVSVTDSAGVTRQVVLRALPAGPYHVVQLVDAAGAQASIPLLFADVGSSGVYVYQPQASVSGMAAQYNIRMQANGALYGDPSDILAFINAVAAVPMTKLELLARVD